MANRKIYPIMGLGLTRVRGRPLKATFLERPNRFTVRAQLANGESVWAHVPNPGRMTGTLAPRCDVWLDGPFAGPRRLPYTMVATRVAKTVVGSVTTYANRLFEYLWKAGAFGELRGRSLTAEVAHGRSRFDFEVGRTLVEVKSVTLASGGVGLFPDAVTARGARHCRELTELVRNGTPAAVVFMAQRGDVTRIAPAAEIDPTFAAALGEAATAGVKVFGCAVEMSPLGARRAWRVPVGGHIG